MRLKTILIAVAGMMLVIIAAAVVALRSIDFNKYKALVAGQVKAATGRDLRIGGNLALEIGFSPAVVVEDVSFGNAPWGSRPEMLKVGRFEVEVALLPLIFRDVRVKRLVLVQADVLLETDAKGNGNWALGGAAPAPSRPAAKPGEIKPGLAAMAVGRVRIEKGTLTFRDGKTKRVTALALDRLDVQAQDATSPLAFDLAAAYEGRTFSLAGTVGPLAELQAPSRPYPVKLALNAGGGTIELDGTIAKPMEAAGLDIKVAAKGQDPAGIARLAGATVPALGPFAATARVTGSPQALSVSDIDASIGKSNLAGNATVSMGGPRPKIKAQLASKHLDLSELLPKGRPAETAAATSKKAPEPSKDRRMFPADTLPLGALTTADADLDLRVDRLVLPNKLSAQALATRVILANGRLDIRPLSTRIAGGTMSGSINLDGSAGKTAALAATIDAKAIDLGDALRQMGHSELVTGAKTDAAMNLRGNGGSVRDLMAGLNGDVLLVLGEGKIHRDFADWLGADLLTQIAEKVNPFSRTEPYSELKCGVIRFAARDGIASSDKGIAFETSKMTVVSSGTANLKSEAIDFTLRPEARQAGGIGAGELAKLLRVRGTLGEPKIGIDELETAKTAASIGEALSRGGLSSLGQALAKKPTADPQPCETAKGRTPAPARTGSAPSATAPAGQAAPKKESGAEQLLRGLFGK